MSGWRGTKLAYTDGSSPCYGCEDRTPGCWDRCERYQDWRKRSDEKREKIQQEKLATADVDAFIKGAKRRDHNFKQAQFHKGAKKIPKGWEE